MGSHALSQPQAPFRLNALKLAPPVAANRAIAREAVCTLVCETPATVTVLCAPAGFGKTTSMNQAYRTLKERGAPVAWLTIDGADNDLGRLTMYMAAALRSVAAELSIDPSQLNEAPGDFSSTNARAYRLLDDLTLIGKDFVLFLDEFEFLTDPEVLGFVDRLIAVLDPGQRLVIGSRRTPNVHLGRLRVQGLLLELAIDALRFSEDETTRFVRGRVQSAIDDSAIRQLHGHTEGWPAALQLATMATLLGRPGATILPPGLSGSIADYLAEDVISRLPLEQKNFLLRSSIFESFCLEMCDQVFGTEDSSVWIRKTEDDNLFLDRIDADGHWYRYHPLFVEFLRKECALTFRGEVRDLRIRAAHWLADSGRTSLAIDQALLAKDHVLAGELIEQCAMRYVRTGQLKAVCGWLSLLPREVIESRPHLMIAGAYANTYLHKYETATDLINAIDAAPVSRAEVADDLLLLKSLIAVWTDKIATAFEIGLASQEHLQSADAYVVGVIHNVIAYSHMFRGYYFFAHQSVATAKRALTTVHALHGLTYSTWLEGALSLLQGDAAEACARASTALAQVVNAGQKYSSASPVSATILMETLYELDELDRIEPLVADYLPLIRETCIPDQAIGAHRIAARMHLLKGRLNEALEVLNILQDLGDARSIPRFAAAARLDRIWIASVASDLSTTSRLLPLVTTESIWNHFGGLWTHAEDIEDRHIASIRYALLSGDLGTAIPKLEQAIHQAEAAGRKRRMLRLQCLLAQAHEFGRRRQRALEILERALTTAHPMGLIRVFADESWCLIPLLEALSLRSTAIPQKYLSRLTEAAKRQWGSSPTPNAVENSAEAVLSPRERQFLTLLAEGFSNKELAARALVAESTVETYLHRINTKLGTRNRTQAVSRGRELGLIA